jgi:hypothetical protein
MLLIILILNTKIMKTLYFNVLLFFIITCYSTVINAQIIADGTYSIYNTTLDEVISVNTVDEGEAGNPQNIIIGRARMETLDSGNDLQQWVFTHQGDDIYKISNVGDSSILGVKDGWCGDFGDVQVGFTNTDTSTLFKVVNGATENTFVIQIAFDANCNFGSMNDPVKVFDIDGGNSGSKINTFTFDSGNANQEFQIVAPSTLSTAPILKNTLTVFVSKTNTLVINSKQKTLAPLDVFIYDISGREVLNAISSKSASINLNHLKSGVYITRINANNTTQIKKFVIQ